MGPLPKRKTSRRRKRNRRSHHALPLQHLVICKDCGAYTPAHHVCMECGKYNGHTVYEIEDKDN